MMSKFHVSPDLFNDNTKNVYHPDSDRKLGHIIKDKHSNSIVQTTEDSQVSLFSGDDTAFMAFIGMGKNKRKKRREPTAWEQRMKRYHNNFDKY